MKIGMLTYHNTNNFGGALQTYALQSVINKLGVECQVIDYRSDVISKRYKVKNFFEIRGLKELIKYLINSRSEKKTKLCFDNFYKNYIKHSKDSYDKGNISKTNQLYDKFIVGSDQVWNLSLSGMDYTYFLDFVYENSKKNSYAASFGVSSLEEGESSKIEKLLFDFNNISIREPKPENFININEDKVVNINLDPTFLIKSDEWSSLSKNKNKEKDYILLYTVASNPEIFDFAKELSAKTGCQILYVHHTHKIRFDMNNIRDIGPQEFLGYIKNAKYVVTTSFHGVALSINFKKDFFYALSNSTNNFNSRITNIINLLDLSDRQIINGQNDKINEAIDYESINETLEFEREKSITFLKHIVNETNMEINNVNTINS
ncbi:polysaccharide pyruvyl transferase family protein [Bacillus sp. AFS017274]|uniref:polysaccharide pyruvyl transferase family protein n=1 Tax=Bacillus sp. AFS017274 TaxID=2033488 RepID=UPI0015CF290F|nr:polysaccharide pyruvyl transferase family protein [Bacillus sp. AFS017274]